MRKLLILTLLLGIGLLPLVPVSAQTQVEIPALTGEYAVGRMTYDWTDAARQDPFLTTGEQSREVSVKVYYPANTVQGVTSTAYAEGLEVDVLAMAQHLPIDVVQTYLRAHAVTDAPLSAAASTFPVVLFSGDISGTALYYTSLLEDIASHGYIVVAISHPYSNQFAVLSDGRVAFAVENANPDAAKGAAGRDQVGAVWTADVQFVLTQLEQLNSDDKRFAGHLDLTRIAIIGHGFGGGVALNLAASDTRIAGAISLDGRVLGESATKILSNPAMFIDPASDSLRPADEKSALDEIKGKSTDILYNLQVTSTSGTTFATDLDLFNSIFATDRKTDFAAVSSPSSILRFYTVAFLDKHLQGLSVPLLDSTENILSGVQLEIAQP